MTTEISTDEIEINVSRICPTTTGVEGAVDANVTLTLPDGRELSGELTLARAHDGWRVYGPPSYVPAVDYWMSGALIRAIDALGLDDEAYRALIVRVAEEASATVTAAQ